jgi:hypothetical protein
MLNFPPFYWQTTRKSVVSFGNIFKDITLVKYNASTRAEIERRIVPITYAGKENYLKRLLQAPNLPVPVEIKLPQMSFELVSLAYDPTRKLQSNLLNYNQTAEGSASQYMGVPYNLSFDLYIYIRNIDDGLQIVEQIFPFFGPDFTLTMDFIDEMNITRNVPIILNNVQMPTEYEGDATDVERRLIWTLNFTMMTNFYGPVNAPGGPITETITNLIDLSTSPGDQLVLDTANTSLGNFAPGEIVYQGVSLSQANAVGNVIYWNASGGQLTISLVSGTFVTNSNVYGTNFGSTVQVISIPNSVVYAKIIDTPVPNTANNIDDDFGFSTEIIEFPYAGSYIPLPGPTPGGGGSGGGNGGGGGSGGSGGNYQVDVYSNGILQQSNAAINFINTTDSTFLVEANGALVDVAFVDSLAQTAYNIATLAYAEANSVSGNNTNFNILTANNLFIGTIANFTTVSGSIVANGAAYILDSFAASQFNTVKYMAQLSAPGYAGGSLQSTEILCMQDGTNTLMTEYATLLNLASLGYFSTTISGGSFQLIFNTYSLSNAVINYKALRNALST